MKKKNNNILSKSLQEVWEWKDEVYKDIKNKNFEEKQEYYREGLNDAVFLLKGKLERNSDNSYFIKV